MSEILSHLKQLRSRLIIEAKKNITPYNRKKWEQAILLLNKTIDVLERLQDK